MQDFHESIQQSHFEESSNTVSEIETLNQSSSHNPIISVNQSEEFQNLDSVPSQQNSSFNSLNNSLNSQVYKSDLIANHEKVEEKVEVNHEPEVKQVKSEILQGSKHQQPEQNSHRNSLQQPKQQAPSTQPAIDYESMVSLKIFEKKINQSLQLKNQGNQSFKAQQYQQAIQKYSQGLRILDPQQFYGATQAQCQKMAQVSASLLFNIGMCFFNISSWKQAEIYFSETITINPNHIKAIYRRALSRYHLQNYEEAMTDIKQAFNKDRSNAEIHEAYEKILKEYNEELKRSKESMKEISSKIFRKDSQNSVNVSPQRQQQNKLQPEEEVKQAGEEETSLWGFAPLVLVAGAALFFGYKKFFGK